MLCMRVERCEHQPGRYAQMAVSCVLATPSPSGELLCFLNEHDICRRQVRGDAAYFSRPLKGHHHDAKALHWSRDSSQCLILTSSTASILNADNLEEDVRLENINGGMGKIVHAELVGSGSLLTVWEFGTTKLWDLSSGRASELPDAKISFDKPLLQLRPDCGARDAALVASISRTAADDVLHLRFTIGDQPGLCARVPSIDLQSMTWSPDGRWLALADTPTANSSIHIYTADAHLYRSYPPAEHSAGGLGVKSLAWSPDGQLLALAKFDGTIELLNTRTFTLVARLEHKPTINQSGPSLDRAIVWEEHVAASDDRSYVTLSQPVSLPLTRTKSSLEPSEVGVIELCFGCNGNFLASRDACMLNTVWVWNMATLAIHAVIIQHNPVRTLLWHPTLMDTLMIDCADGTAALYAVTTNAPPRSIRTGLRSKALLSWVYTPADAPSVILVTEKTTYCLLYPGEKDKPMGTKQAVHDDGECEDSLFDLLSNRKPLPPKTAPSYTEMVDLEVDSEDTIADGLDDTFRGKLPAKSQIASEVDPLDDSEIF